MAVLVPTKPEQMFDNSWWDIQRTWLSNTKFYDSVITKGDVVAVLPLLQDLETMLLVKQFRFPIMKDIWEAPSGMIDGNEEPMRAALRELREKTKYTAELENIWEVGEPVYTSPGLTSERIHLFIAFDCVPDDDQIYDQSDVAHEEIEEVSMFRLSAPPLLEDLKTITLLEAATSLLGA